MKNKAEEIEYLKKLLASSEHLEVVFKELLKLHSSKRNLFLLLQGNYLSEKRAFEQGIISHEEFKRYEDRARNALEHVEFLSGRRKAGISPYLLGVKNKGLWSLNLKSLLIPNGKL